MLLLGEKKKGKKSSKIQFRCIFTKKASLVTVAPLSVGVIVMASGKVELLGEDILCGIYLLHNTDIMDSRFRIP